MRKPLERKRYLLASPWLLAAALGLLAFIIIVFTANNLQREKQLMHDTLLHKGQALVRFVGAGTRASMMTGKESAARVQRLIEQAAADPDILYLALLNDRGRIVAHSDPTRVGRSFEGDLDQLRTTARNKKYRVLPASGEADPVFEVVSPFRPFRRRPRFFRHNRQSGLRGKHGPACRPGSLSSSAEREGLQMSSDWCQLLSPDQGRSTPGYLMQVGLDMSEQTRLVRQSRFHLVLMALVLLLVGAGGWFSLLIAQGYRVSQDTLRHMQAFTGLLISRLPVGIVATGPDGRIRTFNQAAAVMIGKDHFEADGRAPEEVLPPELASYLQHLPPVGKGGEEEIVFNAAEEKRILRVSSVPIQDEQSDALGRVLLLDDMTEQTKLERELRRHERFVALGKMAAGLAHEIRNPLSSIKGFATMLGSKFSSGSSEEQAARLLIKEAERLDRSVSELLDFSRPLPLQLKEVSVADLIRESLQLVRTDAKTLGVDLEAHIDPATPSLHADPDRLNQVLLNLYLNALQAMESKGGRLTVRAHRKNSMMELRIQDSGGGIPEELLERVFDPYFTTKQNGTGLGLAMVQKIIEEHGGRLRLVSSPGQGTEVILELPVAQEK